MISKYYKISCDECLKTEELLSHNMKLCIEEAKGKNWLKIKGKWVCEECKEEKENAK